MGISKLPFGKRLGQKNNLLYAKQVVKGRAKNTLFQKKCSKNITFYICGKSVAKTLPFICEASVAKTHKMLYV